MDNTYKAFRPAIGLRSGHLQTLFPSFFRRQTAPTIESEIFELDDGDFVECSWHYRPPAGSSRAIVILFHGLEGSFNSPYIQGMMNTLKSNGLSSVLMHFRGCSGRENRLHYSYHSGKTDDAKAWIEEVSKRYPKSQLYAIGYSLGGNMLLKLLGEWGDNSLIDRAISISAPMQLDICADRIGRGFSQIYQTHLMRHLKRSLINRYDRHDMKRYIGLDRDEIKRLKTFWEFDNAYTAKVNGFGTATNYYKKASSKQYLKNITTPTLIIHALDDPFMTPDILPKKDEISPYIELEIYPHGGHVGFISGTILKPTYWLEYRVPIYLQTK